MSGFNNSKNKAAVALVAALLAVFVSPMFVQASTIISGTTSGTWTPAGNPYIVAAYTEVATGNTLTIEPGVEVVIGPDVEFRINGVISAVGTYDEPIIFRGTSASSYWERIYIYQNSGNEIGYCQFSDAKTALYVYAYRGNPVMDIDIYNCSFSNLVDYPIYGRAKGWIYCGQSIWREPVTLIANIKNCQFLNHDYGCVFHTEGTQDSNSGNYYQEYGYANPVLSGNIFSNIVNTAVSFTRGPYGGNSTPKIINNTFVGCNHAVSAPNGYYDMEIINNIFVENSSAVLRVDSKSLDTMYNCFYNNSTDFTGYPSTYGQVIWSNDNGDPCDLFYNIFMDPQFEAGSFELSASSPCIDAGDPSIVDTEAPVMGTSTSDMGAYGGEEAGAGVSPSPPTIVSQPQSQTVFLGQDVSFEVIASGSGLNYQWYFGGSELAGETTDTLALTAVDFADAGNYYCSVSNVYDVVDSAIANLRVTEIGLEIAMHAGLHMTNLVIGTTYSIQAVYSLSNTNWVEIDSFQATADNDLWFDTEPANQASKFYQVLSQP